MFMASTKHVDASPVTLKALQKRRDDADRIAKQESDRLQRIADEERMSTEFNKRLVAMRLEAIERERLDDIFANLSKRKRLTKEELAELESVAQRVRLAFGLSQYVMNGPSRSTLHALARHCFCTYAIRIPRVSSTHLGLYLNRDNSTVLHALKIYPTTKARAKRERDRKAKA